MDRNSFYIMLTWSLVVMMVALYLFTTIDAMNINDLNARVTALESTDA